ncbi:MAG TPA: DUF4142 domain-containing protein [Bdellovibrionales bacterium]|nr:DUF4142 domain-containing protein [Bdellovibrionales bacterium]
MISRLVTRISFSLAAVLALAATPVSGLAHSDTQLSLSLAVEPEARAFSESEVLSKVHLLDLSEIFAGRLGAARGMKAEVKDYGKMLLADHRKHDTELHALAQQRSASLLQVVPVEQWEREGFLKQSAALKELLTLRGCAFDMKYLDTMIEAHMFGIELINRNLQFVANTPSADFLNATLPVLQAHLDHAKMLKEGLSCAD